MQPQIEYGVLELVSRKYCVTTVRMEEDFMASTPRQETGAPTAKVMGGTIGAAVATLIIWALSSLGHLTIDESVKVALTTVITFVCGYMIPPSPGDKLRL